MSKPKVPVTAASCSFHPSQPIRLEAAERDLASLREVVRECLFIAENGKPTDESFTLGVIVAKLQESLTS